MFSYRHAFHAGSHADILKHLTLIHLVEYLQEKPGALTIVDLRPLPDFPSRRCSGIYPAPIVLA